MSRERVPLITFLQSYCVTLIVIGHIPPLTHYLPAYPIQFIVTWLYSFVLAPFLLCSGYLFCYTKSIDRLGIKRYLTNKAIKIIIPYIILSAVAFGPKVLLSRYSSRPIDSFNFTNFFVSILYPTHFNPIAYFWFLPMIIIFYCLAIMIRKVNLNPLNIAIITTFLLLISQFNPLGNTEFLSLGKAVEYFIFFWFGMLFYHYEDRILKSVVFNIYLLPIFLILSLYLSTDSHVNLFNVQRLLGLIVSIKFGLIYCNLKFKPFKYIDGYYYQIFLLSYFFIILMKLILDNFMHLGYYPIVITTVLSGLFLPILSTKIISSKIPSLKFIIGL